MPSSPARAKTGSAGPSRSGSWALLARTKCVDRDRSKPDAHVFVIPEYNHGVAPALVNALNYVLVEWNYTLVGLVSFGGFPGERGWS